MAIVRIIDCFLIFELTAPSRRIGEIGAGRKLPIEHDKDNDRAMGKLFILLNGPADALQKAVQMIHWLPTICA